MAIDPGDATLDSKGDALERQAPVDEWSSLIDAARVATVPLTNEREATGDGHAAGIAAVTSGLRDGMQRFYQPHPAVGAGDARDGMQRFYGVAAPGYELRDGMQRFYQGAARSTELSDGMQRFYQSRRRR